MNEKNKFLKRMWGYAGPTESLQRITQVSGTGEAGLGHHASCPHPQLFSFSIFKTVVNQKNSTINSLIPFP